jgi:hypothetical protein
LRLEEEERFVWIDAICVNQDALDERSHQVQLMKDIYAQAARVIVWLGEDEYGLAGKAIELIEIAANRCCATLGKSLEDIGFRDLYTLAPEMFQKDEFEEWEWDIVTWFYRNTWFTRVWIIQEVSHASALVYMGLHETTWPSVGIGASFFCIHRCGRNIGESIAYRRGTNIFIMRFSFNQALWILLLESIDSEATDPRDKVFGLLGFLDEQARNSEFLQPDYKKDVPNVFIDVVRYIIGRHDGVKALSEVFRFFPDAAIDPNETFPSWVPRWDLGIDSFSEGWPNWTAGGAPMENGAEIIDNRILSLKGIKIGVLNLTTQLWPHETTLIEDDISRISILLDTVQQFSSSKTKEAIQEALARTLTLGRVGAIDLLGFLSIARPRLEGHDIERATDFYVNLSKKEFFITDDHCMGVGSKTSELGDVVCIIYGHEMPYLLRPTGTQYKYIGACYLDGFMNGEAIEKFKAGELTEEWFQLQ